jgi:MFS family permease
MGALIGIAGPLVGLALVLGVVYVIENFESWGWKVLAVAGGVVAFLVLLGVLLEALERRTTRKTVERLLALEPRRSWSEWALPAPESYVLLRGGTNVKSDAFKLGLLQMIAMGVLATDGSEGDTTLRRGPALADALAGSLVSIHRLWAASAEDQVQKVADRVVEGQVVQDQIEEAKR